MARVASSAARRASSARSSSLRRSWASDDVHLHARDQLARGERLDEVVVGAGLQPLDARLLPGARGEHDHREVGRRLVRAQARDQPESVEVRHHDVREDHVGALRADRREGGLAVDGRLHRPVRGEHARQVLAHVGVVVHDQDARRPRGAVDSGGTRAAGGGRRRSGVRVRQPAARLLDEAVVRRARAAGRARLAARTTRRPCALESTTVIVVPPSTRALRRRRRRPAGARARAPARARCRSLPACAPARRRRDGIGRRRAAARARGSRCPCRRPRARSRSPRAASDTRTFPSKVNFRAFEIRFSRIFSHMSGSIRTGCGSGSQLDLVREAGVAHRRVEVLRQLPGEDVEADGLERHAGASGLDAREVEQAARRASAGGARCGGRSRGPGPRASARASGARPSWGRASASAACGARG